MYAVLRLRLGADANHELARNVAGAPIDQEHVTEIRMRALVEGARQIDARLHAEHEPAPGDLTCCHRLNASTANATLTMQRSERNSTRSRCGWSAGAPAGRARRLPGASAARAGA